MKVKRTLARFSLLLFVGLFVCLPISEGAASAAPWICGGPNVLGRAQCHGYYTNKNFYGAYGIQGGNILDCTLSARGCVNGESLNNEIPNNINSATDFENLIGYYLNSGYTYNHAGAAFIIDAMLGKSGPSMGSVNNGINYAISQFNNWKSLVDAYAAQGRVQWDVNQPVAYGETNSLHACDPNIAQCQKSSEIVKNDGKDFIFYRDNVPGGEPSHLLIFHNPNGTTFEIRKECANLVGQLDPLSPSVLIPPPKPTCAGVSVDPGQPDPRMTYKVTANVSYQSNAVANDVRTNGAKMFIDVTGPSVNYNNANVGYSIGGAGNDTLTGSVTPGAANNTGTYNIKYGITGKGAITCTGSFYVTDQPTTTTIGGDTDSGAGMDRGGVDCAVPADIHGGMVGWNLEAKGNYAGAGTQYAAYALNHLQDYASAQTGAGGTSSDPTMLAFANNGGGGINLGSGLFGGQFGGGSACIRDYFANATNVQNGNITIGGQTIANSSSTATYVKGNVYITGNITFSGSYANVGEIPSYNVIVEGNIYIAPGVTELDGLYVAEPTPAGSGGTIYTCAPTPFTAQALNSSLYNNCKANSLTFNGAVVARQLWLLRANGTVSSGPAAESVNFTPEIWLTTPPDVVTGNGGAGSYDAITSLPPVL
jgi:hypothetical protein